MAISANPGKIYKPNARPANSTQAIKAQDTNPTKCLQIQRNLYKPKARSKYPNQNLHIERKIFYSNPRSTNPTQNLQTNARSTKSTQGLFTQRNIYKPNAGTKNPTQELQNEREIYKTKAKIYKPGAISTKPVQDLQTRSTKIYKRRIFNSNERLTNSTQNLQTQGKIDNADASMSGSAKIALGMQFIRKICQPNAKIYARSA